MVVTTQLSAEAVRARFAAWSKEWRESKLPPAVRAQGYHGWPIFEVGPGRYRYERPLGWPHRMYTGVLEIALGEDADGTFLHGTVTVRPGAEGIAWYSLGIAAFVAISDGMSNRWTPMSLWIVLLVGATCACGLLLARPFALDRAQEVVPDVEAMLRSALATEPGADRT